MAKKTDTITTCKLCKSDKFVMEYYSYNNKFNKIYPICKKCLISLYKQLIELYDDYMFALVHLCILMDFPFDLEVADRTIDKNNIEFTLNDYFTAVIGELGRKKGTAIKKDSIENISELFNRNSSNDKDNEVKEFYSVIDEFEITSEVYQRWGMDFKKEDLFFLENIYNDLVRSYGGTLPTEKSLYRNYALNELGMKNAREDGKDDIFLKYQNAQSKLMADARLKPTQNNAENTDDFLVGNFIKKIEENRPIAEVSDTFKDVDNISKIIQTEFVDKLTRSIGGVLK